MIHPQSRPPQQRSQRALHLTRARADKPWASDKHDIPALVLVFGIEMPSGLPQETFRSIALHGAAHFAAGRDADTTSIPTITPDNQYQERMCPGFPLIKDPPDVPAAPESDSPFHDSVDPAIAGWADSAPRSRVSHTGCETVTTTSHASRASCPSSSASSIQACQHSTDGGPSYDVV